MVKHSENRLNIHDFATFFSSDHYVSMLTSPRKNETNPTYPIYFTWNKEKCSKLSNTHGVNALHVQHPWISYRRRKYSKRNQDAKGTLLFWPHGNPSLTVRLDIKRVEQILMEIPEKYEPLSICVSSHDIQLGGLRDIRTLNYPIYTVGNLQDQSFVDRFYKLINNFKYSAGFNGGSHVFYLHEFGIPYLALDNSLVTALSHGNDEIPDGKIDLLVKDFQDADQRRLFDNWYLQLQTFSDVVSEEQASLAREYLGCGSNTSIWTIRKLVYSALLRNMHLIPKLSIRQIQQMKNEWK